MPNNGGLAPVSGALVAIGSETKWQWQAGLTSHDPNPPITLETASAATIAYASALQSPTFEAALFGGLVR
jgi:hypothetical protein